MGPGELAELRGDSENSPRDDLGVLEAKPKSTRGLGDEGEDTTLVLPKARLVVSSSEGAEHVEVLGEGAQEATVLLGGAMNSLKSENREGACSTRIEGPAEAKLAEPGAGPAMMESSSIPSDEINR